MRLSPFDPLVYFAYGALGHAAIQEGRHGDAAESFAKAVQASPRFSTVYLFHAASLALAGRQEEARPVVARLLELETGFRSRVIFEYGYVRELMDKLAEGPNRLTRSRTYFTEVNGERSGCFVFDMQVSHPRRDVLRHRLDFAAMYDPGQSSEGLGCRRVDLKGRC